MIKAIKRFLNSSYNLGPSATNPRNRQHINNDAYDKPQALSKYKVTLILDYCEPYLHKMWAASIVGIILGCDFTDVETKLADYKGQRRCTKCGIKKVKPPSPEDQG